MEPTEFTKSKKNVIFITPEELEQLPSDAPVYVLSSSKNEKDTYPPIPCNTFHKSNGLAHIPPTYFSGTFDTSLPSPHQNFQPVRLSIFPNIHTQPGCVKLPSVNDMLINNCRGPALTSASTTQSTSFPNFQKREFFHPNASKTRNFAQSCQLPYPPFFGLMHTPPPTINKPPLSLPLLYIPPPQLPKAASRTNYNQVVQCPSNRAEGFNSPSSIVPKQSKTVSSIPKEVKHTRKQIIFKEVSCSTATDYFKFDKQTGCHLATDLQIRLENEFEERVLHRRSRSLSENKHSWSPLHRPEITDAEPENRTTSFSKNGRKRAGGRRLSEKRKFAQNNSEKDESQNSSQNCDSKDPDQHIRKNSSVLLNEHDLIYTDSVSPHELMDMITNKLPSTSKSISRPSCAERGIRQQAEIAHKLAHPLRLHPDVWHNEAGEHNNGPACSCKPKYRIGPLHNQYEGETEVPLCNPESNNRDRLFHYRVTVNPTTNFFNLKPTKIVHDGHTYHFDGFSIFLHYRLDKLPSCQLLRFNLLYDFQAVEEDFPENFTVRSLDMLTQYIFNELLELLDLNLRPSGIKTGCQLVHLLPRFIYYQTREKVANMIDNESEQVDASESNAKLLSINVILEHWMRQTELPVIDALELSAIQQMTDAEWSIYINDLRGTLAWYPGKKPSTLRIDQIDRRSVSLKPSSDVLLFPFLVHMTYTPMKLSLSREPKYKSVLKNFMKLQYLLMNKPRITTADRAHLTQLANELDRMEHSGVHRREVTVEISCESFHRTGIRPDITQFAVNMASFIAHIRFHKSLEALEQRLNYSFNDKSLLHQALTHPSYRRTNFGTNQDHFQNTLVSCGPRTIEYGDKLQLYQAWRKKGLSKMIQVMSLMPKLHEERSKIYGNERLEFLGDAVIEIIASIHLFSMFPDLPEGSLDAYRQALVQNQHLAELALRLGIHRFLLYTHSVDFCYDSTYIYARSDAFEAVMAAIALDAGLDTVDRIFGAILFGDCSRIHKVWVRLPQDPLQEQFPDGDRHWAVNVPMLKKLTRLEDQLGIKFKHIRVLARALTVRKTGFNLYTLGDNQRLEFLGDSLLKYVSTDYLFRHFPRHHEGHLSLLKNSLVNKYTQASVCTELGLDTFIIRREENSITTTPGQNCTDEELSSSNKLIGSNAQKQNVKYKADLLEAFIGALYVDKDLTWVERFCQVCFWPRLVEFILKQEWNDAKSKLQQCCLTFRSLNEDPEIAHYKVLDYCGPTNQRVYRVGVFFRRFCLAVGTARSVQLAQMEAAKLALEKHQETFKQLDFQRSVITKRYKQPFIDKMLNQLESWDENLVERFVGTSAEDEFPSSSLSPLSIPSKRSFHEAPPIFLKSNKIMKLASDPHKLVACADEEILPFTVLGVSKASKKSPQISNQDSDDCEMSLDSDLELDEDNSTSDSSKNIFEKCLSGTVADFFIDHSPRN